MGKEFNKDKLKQFLLRRKLNYYSLLAITLFCILITGLCILFGWIPERLFILAIVDVLLILLCILQTWRLNKSFRTMRSFKGSRKRKERSE